MFLSNAILEVSKPGQWVVYRPLVWQFPKDTLPRLLTRRITVPAGFVTDLASVPRFLRDRRAFDVNGASRRPAVLHDFLYATGMGGKAFADDVFRLALRSEGVGAINAWAFYQAVHWFGGRPYRAHAAARMLEAAKRK